MNKIIINPNRTTDFCILSHGYDYYRQIKDYKYDENSGYYYKETNNEKILYSEEPIIVGEDFLTAPKSSKFDPTAIILFLTLNQENVDLNSIKKEADGKYYIDILNYPKSLEPNRIYCSWAEENGVLKKTGKTFATDNLYPSTSTCIEYVNEEGKKFAKLVLQGEDCTPLKGEYFSNNFTFFTNPLASIELWFKVEPITFEVLNGKQILSEKEDGPLKLLSSHPVIAGRSETFARSFFESITNEIKMYNKQNDNSDSKIQ